MIDSRDMGAVRILSMVHGKANTLDIEFLAALERDLETTAGDEAVKALVLTGNGSIFSAGVDLFRIVEGGREYLEAFLPALSSVLFQLFTLPKPVIAAVNGHAIAGGCILACASDVRIGIRGGGQIGVPELRVGVPFPSAALEIVRFAVGNERLSEVVLGGGTYTPEDALDLGFLNRLVDSDDLLDSALHDAEQLADMGASTFVFSKRQLRRETVETVKRESSLGDGAILELWSAPETQARIRDYLDRTLSRR